MCKVGDIILIDGYMSSGENVSRHSFVVINDEGGNIQGLDYDIICNVMSSFKNEEQKRRKLNYPGNFPITNSDSTVIDGNDKDGYIKAEQLYFFNKDKTDFTVIGSIKPDIFELLMEFISQLQIDIEVITDNL